MKSDFTNPEAGHPASTRRKPKGRGESSRTPSVCAEHGPAPCPRRCENYVRRYFADHYRNSKRKIRGREGEKRVALLKESGKRSTKMWRLYSGIRKRRYLQHVFACLEIIMPVESVSHIVPVIIDDEMLESLHVTKEIRELFLGKIRSGEVVKDTGFRHLAEARAIGSPDVILHVEPKGSVVAIRVLLTLREEFHKLWKKIDRQRREWYSFAWPGLEAGQCTVTLLAPSSRECSVVLRQVASLGADGLRLAFTVPALHISEVSQAELRAFMVQQRDEMK